MQNPNKNYCCIVSGSSGEVTWCWTFLLQDYFLQIVQIVYISIHESITLLLTNSMEQSPSWETNRFSGSREISHISWNTKVYYRIHESPPPVPNLSQINPTHNPHPLPEDPFNIILPTLLCNSPNTIRSTYLSHLIIDSITRIVFGEQFRSLNSSLCSFLHSLGASPLQTKIFSSLPYSQTPSAYVPFSMWATKFHTHTKKQANLYFCIS
jgi:hypothetical protein